MKTAINITSHKATTVARMTPELERLIARSEQDLKERRNVSPIFNNADQAIAYLHRKRKKK